MTTFQPNNTQSLVRQYNVVTMTGDQMTQYDTTLSYTARCVQKHVTEIDTTPPCSRLYTAQYFTRQNNSTNTEWLLTLYPQLDGLTVRAAQPSPHCLHH